MEKFINEWIVHPLHDAINDEIYFDVDDLLDGVDFCKREDAMYLLHEKMHPYYRMFFEADLDMFKYGPSGGARRFILKMMSEDEWLIPWFTENFQIMDVVHAWARCYGKNKHESNQIMDVLLILLAGGYECDWEFHVRQLRNILLREEIEGNQYSRSVYCMFHGFVMLGKAELPQEVKEDLYKQYAEHWFFLRFLYSAMFRCVIGCGFTNFVQIPHQMKSRVDYYPFLHLFYATVMEQKEEICRRGAKREKLEASLVSIRELAHKEQSDELNVLCCILFPKVWKDYIERNRLKNYKELEDELQRITAQIRVLAEQLSNTISIDVIAQKLLDLPPQTARAVFLELNAMLMKNEAWIKKQEELYHCILTRTNTPNLHINHVDQVIGVAESNAHITHTKI